jgi:hypothetical protein
VFSSDRREFPHISEDLMVNRGALLLITTLVFTLVFAGPAAAQGKKKPASWPGTAEFRCNGLATPCADGDLIVGDGTSYPGHGTPEGGDGAHLKTTYEGWIGLRNGRQLFIDFVAQDPNAPCIAGGYCQFATAFPNKTMLIDGVTYGEISTNVVNPNDTADVMPTLLDIPLNATWPARVLISFNDPYTGSLWNFNFSDTRRPDASLAQITRTGTCTWVISDGDSVAELSTLVRLQGKSFRSQEGLYSAPFQITFNAPNCPTTP